MASQPDWGVLNRGVNGERSDEIRARFDRDVVAARPDVVVVIAGVNDIYQGRPAGSVTRELEAIYDAARGAGLPVVAGSILPVQHGDAGPERPDARRQRLDPRLCGAARRLAFADTRAAAAAPGQPDRLLSSPDDLHPSPEGYRAMALALEPAVISRLPGTSHPVTRGAISRSACVRTLCRGGFVVSAGVANRRCRRRRGRSDRRVGRRQPTFRPGRERRVALRHGHRRRSSAWCPT